MIDFILEDYTLHLSYSAESTRLETKICASDEDQAAWEQLYQLAKSGNMTTDDLEAYKKAGVVKSPSECGPIGKQNG